MSAREERSEKVPARATSPTEPRGLHEPRLKSMYKSNFDRILAAMTVRKSLARKYMQLLA